MPQSDQGITNDRYKVIPRTAIFLRLWTNKYNGLGGHVERGEDVLSAARRELLEETGHTARPATMTSTFAWRGSRRPGM